MQEQRYDIKGYIQIPRAIFKKFSDRAHVYSELEAITFLLAGARYGTDPVTEIIGGKRVTWGRGQLPATSRYLAGAWKWTRYKVETFLKELEEDGFVTTSQSGGQLIITVVDFQIYVGQTTPLEINDLSENSASEDFSQQISQQISQPTDSLPTDLSLFPASDSASKSAKKEKGFNKKDNKKKQIHNSAIEQSFESFWVLYDKKIDRAKCLKLWTSLTDQERDKALTHAPPYVQSTPEKRYRKNPATYLGNKSFENEICQYDGRQSTHNGTTTGERAAGITIPIHGRSSADTRPGTSGARVAALNEW